MDQSNAEAELMDHLGQLVQLPATLRFLEGVCFALRAQLRATPEVKSTHLALPLEIYGPSLPGDIKSSWVFVLRAGGYAHPAERHPNSIQRVFRSTSPV